MFIIRTFFVSVLKYFNRECIILHVYFANVYITSIYLRVSVLNTLICECNIFMCFFESVYIFNTFV